MTHHDDFLDAGTAERLLAGTVAPADAPPGYGQAAAVLAAARAGVPAPAPNLAELARVAGESVSQPGSPLQTRRSPVLVKLLTVKAAAAAGVIILGATGAAAATGSLPGAAQSVAHSALSKVGVDVPDDDANDSTEPAESSDETKVKDNESTSTTSPSDQPPTGVPAATPGSDDPANHDAADNEGDDQSNDSADDQGQDEADHQGEDAQDPTSSTTTPDASSDGQSGDGGSDHSGSGSGSSGDGSDSSGGGLGEG